MDPPRSPTKQRRIPFAFLRIAGFVLIRFAHVICQADPGLRDNKETELRQALNDALPSAPTSSTKSG
jgi:hypothetical protein